MSKASKKQLEELHAAVAKALADGISQQWTDDDGKPIPPPAAVLNVARQFLKDNHIEGPATAGTPLGTIAAKLPAFDDYDDASTSH